MEWSHVYMLALGLIIGFGLGAGYLLFKEARLAKSDKPKSLARSAAAKQAAATRRENGLKKAAQLQSLNGSAEHAPPQTGPRINPFQ